MAISLTTAHRELVTKHNTMSWLTKDYRVAIRKRSGRFYVTYERLEDNYKIVKSFATLFGAIDCATVLRRYGI